jgi:hypothetical protein
MGKSSDKLQKVLKGLLKIIQKGTAAYFSGLRLSAF